VKSALLALRPGHRVPVLLAPPSLAPGFLLLPAGKQPLGCRIR